MSDWSYWICDTQTGVKQAPVFPATTGWARMLNTAQESRTAFNVLDNRNASLRRGQLSQPWRYTLVHQWRNTPIYAGVILDDDPDYDTGVLTVAHSDIRTIFGSRTTLGENGYGGVAGGRDEILNQTLDSIASRVIRDGMVGPMPNYPLPIVLPAPVASNFSRTYWDWNFPFVDQILDDIQSYEAGPDTEFAPSWTPDGNLQWTFRSGYLTGPLVDFPMNVAKPSLFNVGLKRDARKQATETYAVGKGTEADMKVAYAHVGSSTLPALVRVQQYKDIQDPAQLQGQANGDLNTFKAPTVQWRMKLKADGKPGLLDMVLGATFRMYFKDHWWSPDGWTSLRLIGMTGDHTNDVTLHAQPTGTG